MAGIILLLFGIGMLSGSALAAFCWAVRDGQFRDLDAAPRVIFDDDEPVGVPTDCFPDERSRQARDRHLKQA